MKQRPTLRVVLLAVSFAVVVVVAGAGTFSQGPKLAYRLVADPIRLPTGVVLGEVTGLDVDSKDNLFVLRRAKPYVMVFDKDGQASPLLERRLQDAAWAADRSGRSRLDRRRGQPSRAEVRAGRQAAPDARDEEQGRRRRAPFRQARRRDRRAGRRDLRRRRLREFADRQVLRRRASSSRSGARKARPTASSTSRTPSSGTRPASSTSATARTAASRSSTATASIWRRGRTSAIPTASTAATARRTSRTATAATSASSTRTERRSRAGTSRKGTKDEPHWLCVDTSANIYVGFVTGKKLQKWTKEAN